MRAYLLTLFGASLTVALVGLLIPERGRRTVRLISSLFLLCVLAAPLPKAFRAIRDYTLTDTAQGAESDYEKQMQAAIDQASRTYFAQALTALIAERFALADGTVRCAIAWRSEDGATPETVTVILSGSSIWKDPDKIEEFVRARVGCECKTAIE